MHNNVWLHQVRIDIVSILLLFLFSTPQIFAQIFATSQLLLQSYNASFCFTTSQIFARDINTRCPMDPGNHTEYLGIRGLADGTRFSCNVFRIHLI